MAIPSGAGTEVLRHAAIHANNATVAQVDWGASTGSGSVRSSGNTSGVVAVPANVIITVLTITHLPFVLGAFNARINWQGSGTDIYIFKDAYQPADTTWVWNDKIVLREGDILQLYNAGSNSDWTVSFIYQDWT